MRVWPGTGPRTASAVRSPRMDSLRAAPAARPRVPPQRGCSRSINLGAGLTPAGSSDAPSARTLDHAPQSGQRAASDRPGHSRALHRASSAGTGRCRRGSDGESVTAPACVPAPPACPSAAQATGVWNAGNGGDPSISSALRSAAPVRCICRVPVPSGYAWDSWNGGLVPGGSSPDPPPAPCNGSTSTARARAVQAGIPNHRSQTSRDRGERRSGPDAGAMRPRGCRSTASERYLGANAPCNSRECSLEFTHDLANPSIT